MLKAELYWHIGQGQGFVRVVVDASVEPEHEHILRLGHIVSDVHELVESVEATLRGELPAEVE
jgi:hypothetical protein